VRQEWAKHNARRIPACGSHPITTLGRLLSSVQARSPPTVAEGPTRSRAVATASARGPWPRSALCPPSLRADGPLFPATPRHAACRRSGQKLRPRSAGNTRASSPRHPCPRLWGSVTHTRGSAQKKAAVYCPLYARRPTPYPHSKFRLDVQGWPPHDRDSRGGLRRTKEPGACDGSSHRGSVSWLVSPPWCSCRRSFRPTRLLLGAETRPGRTGRGFAGPSGDVHALCPPSLARPERAGYKTKTRCRKTSRPTMGRSRKACLSTTTQTRT